MNIQKQIDAYLAEQSESKQIDMREIDRLIRAVEPECKLWFLDGKNAEGRVVSNPNIG